ncbi:hypothetical protein HUN92_03745 [Bacillus firmus]|uniref:hypothetical protein n=1 Tax=Cytobacillus TaxID=2675230 RepID=UPI00119E103D|nr:MULTISPECIES: hypothetical protein [Cytobacillus]MBZ9534515.1 hypothetical protein [Cytobacillus oceanisediminis]NUH82897.1 hypothetical protein [Cytobacillus firmus]
MSFNRPKHEPENLNLHVSPTMTPSEVVKMAKLHEEGILEKPKKESEKDITVVKSFTILSSLSEKLEEHVYNQKKQGVTKYDVLKKKDRKVSVSSWITEAIEEKLKREVVR